jgi:hypothetical protein
MPRQRSIGPRSERRASYLAEIENDRRNSAVNMNHEGPTVIAGHEVRRRTQAERENAAREYAAEAMSTPKLSLRDLPEILPDHYDINEMLGKLGADVPVGFERVTHTDRLMYKTVGEWRAASDPEKVELKCILFMKVERAVEKQDERAKTTVGAPDGKALRDEIGHRPGCLHEQWRPLARVWRTLVGDELRMGHFSAEERRRSRQQ